MNTKNMSSTKMRRCVSCGQKTAPNITNFLSMKLSSKSGCPPIFIKGPENNKASNIHDTQRRRRCNFPAGFFGYIQDCFPFLSTLESVSLKCSGLVCNAPIFNSYSILPTAVAISSISYFSPCGSFGFLGVVPCRLMI